MKFYGQLFSGLLATFVLSLGSVAFADTVPDCQAGGQSLTVNDAQVLIWKQTTANQFRGRAHIQGTLQKIYPDHSGHHHFQVKIGTGADDTIEVIYNEAFGLLPAYQVGSQIEACGDYITSNQRSGHLPASPDGAIVHWVHKAPAGGHDSGYLAIDGTVCGQ